MIQQKASSKHKQPASGAIAQCLEQMDDDFEKNLETAASDEKEAVAQFKEMKAAKQKEIKAGSETIAILTDDDNADMMRKGTFFLQVAASTRASTADRVATSLRKAGKRFRDPRLMAVSISMRLDAFAKVKENIDKTIEALK